MIFLPAALILQRRLFSSVPFRLFKTGLPSLFAVNLPSI
jgi:hypothetical protein